MRFNFHPRICLTMLATDAIIFSERLIFPAMQPTSAKEASTVENCYRHCKTKRLVPPWKSPGDSFHLPLKPIVQVPPTPIVFSQIAGSYRGSYFSMTGLVMPLPPCLPSFVTLHDLHSGLLLAAAAALSRFICLPS